MSASPELSLAQRALASGDIDQAAAGFTSVLRKTPGHAEARLGLARTLLRAGHPGPALQTLAPLFTLPASDAPAVTAAWLEAAFIHRACARFQDARLTLENAPPAVRRHPAWAINLSDVLLEQGHPRAARDILAGTPGLLANHAGAASSWLRSQLYLPETTTASLAAAARQWALWHGGDEPVKRAPADADPERRLRLVFVSSRLCAHNSAQQLLGILPALDRRAFHVTLVASGGARDAVTARLRELADSWLDLPEELPVDETVKRLSALAPDILVDQHEHSNNGPIALFTRRIAPVQLHWYCNALSTGLRTLDARFSDVITEPEGEADRLSSEPIVRLPHGYLAYTPPPGAAEPADRPPEGPLVLGGIAHLAKYTDEVLAVWAGILRRLPEARLLLGRHSLADKPTREAFAARCVAAGIPADRLELRPDDGAIRSLAFFNELDLVLDTWPFGGEATSMDALWMGTPIITLCGERITARRTTALLLAVDRPDLVTHTTEDYIARVMELAADPAALRASRATMRHAVRSAHWTNGPVIANDMAEAFRRLWRQACATAV